MGFHEYILSAILLLIVAQAFTFISKIMKNSLQNFHSYIEIFDFQINVFILESFCPLFPSISSQVLRDPFITKSW